MQLFKEYRRYEYKKWLDTDPNLRRWYFNLMKGSVMTADVYLRKLGNFCRLGNTTPAEFAKMPKRKMEDIAFDFIQEMEQKINPATGKKYAPSYVECFLKAILSWAKWNRKAFEMKIKIADLSKRPAIEKERIPTTEELKRVLFADTTPLRTRASIAIMAFSGARPGVQGSYLGLDGLKVGDFPELKIETAQVSFKRIPTLIIVRAELSKSRHWYPTFMLEEGCEILKEWLERRIQLGEVITPESGIIATTSEHLKDSSRLGIKDESSFLRTPKVTAEIRRVMRMAGLPWRPYILRSYFDTMLLLGESKGMVSYAYQQLWMGHKGSIEATYTVRKGELPEELVEDMRGAYSRVSELLSITRNNNLSENRVTEKFNKQFLILAGWTEEEVNALGIDLGTIEQSRMQELLEQKSNEKMGASASGQKVILISEVKDYINKGYEFVTRLDDKECIVRIPK